MGWCVVVQDVVSVSSSLHTSREEDSVINTGSGDVGTFV